MKKIDFKEHWEKIVVVILLLADLGAGYPVYSVYSEDPKDALSPPTFSKAAFDIESDDDDDEIVKKGGKIPTNLLLWNTFFQPTFKPSTTVVVEDDEDEVIEDGMMPMSTEGIYLLGVIKLNGQFLALVSVDEEPSGSVREGDFLPNYEDVKVAKIRYDGIYLDQSGYRRTFMPLNQPRLDGKQW